MTVEATLEDRRVGPRKERTQQIIAFVTSVFEALRFFVREGQERKKRRATRQRLRDHLVKTKVLGSRENEAAWSGIVVDHPLEI